jgi:hypothetical protein
MKNGASGMSLPTWLPDWLTPALELGRTQQFGLAFLLGSFTVATWSDLKRLSAQREFVEIWLVFTLAMLGYDAWSVHVGGMPPERVGVKWGLIILASILSVSWVGVLFRLAPADVAALAAAASLLSPGLVICFYALARVLAWLARPVLAGGRTVWPFMPVVTLATLAVLALGWLL